MPLRNGARVTCGARTDAGVRIAHHADVRGAGPAGRVAWGAVLEGDHEALLSRHVHGRVETDRLPNVDRVAPALDRLARKGAERVAVLIKA
jgi:hypothetical protein